jgi:hypothetical protein
MTLTETRPVFIICGFFVAVMTLQYRSILYPEKAGGKKKK